MAVKISNWDVVNILCVGLVMIILLSIVLCSIFTTTSFYKNVTCRTYCNESYAGSTYYHKSDYVDKWVQYKCTNHKRVVVRYDQDLYDEDGVKNGIGKVTTCDFW